MNAQVFEFDTQCSIAELRQARLLVFRRIYSGFWRVWRHVLSLIQVVSLLLFAGVVTMKGLAMNGLDVSDAALIWYAGTFGGGMLLVYGFHLHTNRFLAVARGSKWSDGLVVRIDEQAVQTDNGRSRWKLSWRDIEAVLDGRKVIVLQVSNIAIPVPKRVFATADEASRAVGLFREWQVASAAGVDDTSPKER